VQPSSPGLSNCPSRQFTKNKFNGRKRRLGGPEITGPLRRQFRETGWEGGGGKEEKREGQLVVQSAIRLGKREERLPRHFKAGMRAPGVVRELTRAKGFGKKKNKIGGHFLRAEGKSP